MSTKPEYLFPRLGLIDITKISNINQLLSNIEEYHGKYFQIFNLTNASIFTSEQLKSHETKFKWRGVPFSLTEAIKILTKMDTFLRTCKGNSIIFCVNCFDAYNFVRIIIREYLKICQWGLSHQQKTNKLTKILQKHQVSISFQHPLFSECFLSAYRHKQISSPPVKIISSFSISTQNFIPIFEIYQQSRYNDFQLVYTHQITNQLAEYYFNLNKPLEKDLRSTGKKYYDRKPETKYLKHPVIVCGDVKIVCYSFNTLQKKRQFSLGFCTKRMEFSEQLGDYEGIITFAYTDLYDKESSQNTLTGKKTSSSHLFDENIEAYLKIQNFCDNQSCIYQAKCQECQEHSKKFNLRYNQTQSELNKLYRQRSVEQVTQYFSLQ